MKRISILCVSALFAASSFAQPSAGGFGVEINFNPGGLFEGGTNTFGIDGLKARYFFADNMAVRGALNFQNTSTTNANYGIADNKLFSTNKTNGTLFGFTPGFEYHLVTADKYSIYAGVEIGFATGSVNSSLTYENPTAVLQNTESKGNVFGFNAGIFTGLDYYVTSKIYVGVELGLGYSSTKTTPNASTTVGSTTTKNDSYQTNGAVGFNITPNFRLGWNF